MDIMLVLTKEMKKYVFFSFIFVNYIFIFFIKTKWHFFDDESV
jgi:hypothetical protein